MKDLTRDLGRDQSIGTPSSGDSEAKWRGQRSELSTKMRTALVPIGASVITPSQVAVI